MFHYMKLIIICILQLLVTALVSLKGSSDTVKLQDEAKVLDEVLEYVEINKNEIKPASDLRTVQEKRQKVRKVSESSSEDEGCVLSQSEKNEDSKNLVENNSSEKQEFASCSYEIVKKEISEDQDHANNGVKTENTAEDSIVPEVVRILQANEFDPSKTTLNVFDGKVDPEELLNVINDRAYINSYVFKTHGSFDTYDAESGYGTPDDEETHVGIQYLSQTYSPVYYNSEGSTEREVIECEQEKIKKLNDINKLKSSQINQEVSVSKKVGTKALSLSTPPLEIRKIDPSGKANRVRDYFALDKFEDSECFAQANNVAGIILNSTASQSLPQLDKVFAHSFTCKNSKCSSICKLFNAIAVHVNNTSQSHQCALRYVYTKFATLHFDTCCGKQCGIPNCAQFQKRRRERKAMKKMESMKI